MSFWPGDGQSILDGTGNKSQFASISCLSQMLMAGSPQSVICKTQKAYIYGNSIFDLIE